MSEWKEITMGEVVETNRSSINKDYPYSEILYLDTGSITCNRISGLQRFSLSEAPSRAKRLVKDLDIIYSSVRPNQLHYGIIRDPEENLVVSTGFIVISCNEEEIEPYFLFHYLSQGTITEFLHSIAEGSTSAYPSLKPSDIEALEIFLPPLPEQRAIASVLSSLDDKIDLLHRQNATLEALAETLFRQWFVEESGGNWEEVTVSNYAEHSKKSVKPSANPNAVYAHYSIPGFDSGKEPVFEIGQEIRSNKYQVFENTILFSKLNPHKDKRVWLILENVQKNAICSTEFQVLKPYDQNHLYFLYGWLSNSENYREISSGVGGTSGSHQRISPSEIFSFPAPMISNEVLNDYTKNVKPIFIKQQNNQTQIRTLTALRDTLLPKLMSGEIQLNTN